MKPTERAGWALWFAFCGVIALGFLVLIAWFIIAAIRWMGMNP